MVNKPGEEENEMSNTFVLFSQKNSIKAAICSFEALVLQLMALTDKQVANMNYDPLLKKMMLSIEEIAEIPNAVMEEDLSVNETAISIPLQFPCKTEQIISVIKRANRGLFHHLLRNDGSLIEDIAIADNHLSITIKKGTKKARDEETDEEKPVEKAIYTDEPAENHLLLIDGNNLLNKVHFATSYGKEPEELEKDDNGNYIAAVKVFVQQIGLMLKKYSPNLAAVCWDTSKGSSLTFRAKLFPEYKATREEKKHSDVFFQQYKTTREILKQMGIPQFADESGEFEADDLIGTLQRLTKDTIGYANCTIVSSDKDLYQLLDDRTVQIFKKGKQQVAYSIADFREEYMGLEPLQMPHIKGIVGDKSDNIKGVNGCGEKTIPLLKEFKSIEGILENLHTLPEFEEGKYKRYIKKFEEGKQEALLSLKLATIVTDVPFMQSMNVEEELQLTIDKEGSREAFRRLNF